MPGCTFELRIRLPGALGDVALRSTELRDRGCPARRELFQHAVPNQPDGIVLGSCFGSAVLV
jgi:hypothetical protein